MRPTALALALLASAAASAQSASDDWDVSRGTVVTAHSELDHDPPAGGYDVRDMFGAELSPYAPERGNVVFYDFSGGPGYVDYVEWQSPSALGIVRYSLEWADDTPGDDWRNLAHFSLFGRLGSGDAWTLLVSQNTPSQVGDAFLTGTLPGDPYRYWRAEFTRGDSTNDTAYAERIRELDGWVEPVPEPAAMAALGLGVLGLMGRRKRA